MEKQRFDMAITFIEMGADVNYHYPLTSSYADGMTPLIYASKWNNFDLVKILLENGAFVNARTTDGNTALSISYTNENTQIYNYLTEHGAVETRNNTIQPAQSTGMSSLLDNQTAVFQRGTYRLTGGTMSIRFTGNTISGTISYTINGRANNGAYAIAGNNLTVAMEGRTFVYKIDSNTSFSGNGEIWTRTGD
jgi:ankyrin repeat protein